LSRRSEYRPEKGGVENQPITTVLGRDNFGDHLKRSFVCSSARLSSIPEKKWTKEFLADVRKEGKKDQTYEQAREQEAVTEEPSLKDQRVKELSCEDNLL